MSSRALADTGVVGKGIKEADNLQLACCVPLHRTNMKVFITLCLLVASAAAWLGSLSDHHAEGE